MSGGARCHTKADCSATLRGLRGRRIGEASHPGPRDRDRPLKIWAHSLSSWHRHGLALLDRANDENVHVLTLCEVNLSRRALASATHVAANKGWHMLAVPTQGPRRGGVAVLVRSPLVALTMEEFTEDQSQGLVVEIHEGQRSLLVGAAYRTPDEDRGIFQDMLLHLTRAGRPWIWGMDANASLATGEWSEAVSNAGAVVQAVARHNRGTEPIDGLVSSGDLVTVGPSVELQAEGGDHSIAQCTLDLTCRGRGPEWRFAKVRRDATQDLVAVSWDNIAAPADAWQRDLDVSVEAAWSTWAHDAEAWLTAAGAVQAQEGERPLGSVPRLVHGSHRVAVRQSTEERVLRRHVRRLREGQLMQWKGRPVPRALVCKLMATQSPPEEFAAVRNQRFGEALRLAEERLHKLLLHEQESALRLWKQEIHTVQGACKWLRKEAALPAALLHNDQVYNRPAEAVELLRTHWTEVFGRPHDPRSNVDAFWQHYGTYVRAPARGFPRLPPLTGGQLRLAAQKMSHKAGGPDGFTPLMLTRLPTEALGRLSQVLNKCEEVGRFPRPMKHWKLVFLPKNKHGQLPGPGDTRPIAVGSAVYRCWGRARLAALSSALAECCEDRQAGPGGHDAETLLCALEVECPPHEYPVGAALDYAKAFDSVDSSLAISVFQRLGVPPQITQLLQDQWSSHERWPCFGGATSQCSIQGCEGLPQGDVWSPSALNCILALVLRDVASRAGTARNFVYLDDRTIVAQTVAGLDQACNVWQELETCTRLRTNNAKTQYFGRSPAGMDALRVAGWDAGPSAKVLGATIGMLPRGLSQDERRRANAARQVAWRLEALPLPLKSKAAIAALVYSTKAVWGCLFGGRPPTIPEADSYKAAFRRAVKGGEAKADRSSRPLQQVLLLGHTSDLAFIGTQRLLCALGRWANVLRRRGQDFRRFRLRASTLGAAITSTLHEWGWSPRRGWAVWGGRDHEWSLEKPLHEQRKAAHQLRDVWRIAKLKEWLAHSTRRDADLARQEGILPDLRLLKRLRHLATKVDGHGVGVMCGGFSTDAKWSPMGAVRDMCHDCGRAVTPAVEHKMWECEQNSRLRTVSRPQSAVAARLGWCALAQGREEDRIHMMGRVRAADVAARKNRPSWAGWVGQRQA